MLSMKWYVLSQRVLILDVAGESDLQFKIRKSFGNLVIGLYFLWAMGLKYCCEF